MTGDPIEGQMILLATAKSSVGDRLPSLVDRVQDHLGPDRAEYRRQYETVYADDERLVLLAEDGFWDDLAVELELTPRERDAVRRAHVEQTLRIGRNEGREGEFETALEIREPLVLGR